MEGEGDIVVDVGWLLDGGGGSGGGRGVDAAPTCGSAGEVGATGNSVVLPAAESSSALSLRRIRPPPPPPERERTRPPATAEATEVMCDEARNFSSSIMDELTRWVALRRAIPSPPP